MRLSFVDGVRAAVVGVALSVGAYLAVVQHSDVAVGAVLAALAAGVGWAFPGKPEKPTETPYRPLE